MNIFSTFDYSHLQQEVAWLVIIYLATLFAMFLDFITGVRKAKKLNIATTSRGFRKTAEKAMQYLLPMFCLTLVDMIASFLIDYPYLTALMGIFNIYIELKSIWENTHTAEQTHIKKEKAEDIVKFIAEHKDDILKILAK